MLGNAMFLRWCLDHELDGYSTMLAEKIYEYCRHNHDRSFLAVARAMGWVTEGEVMYTPVDIQKMAQAKRDLKTHRAIEARLSKVEATIEAILGHPSLSIPDIGNCIECDAAYGGSHSPGCQSIGT